MKHFISQCTYFATLNVNDVILCTLFAALMMAANEVKEATCKLYKYVQINHLNPSYMMEANAVERRPVPPDFTLMVD